MPRRKERLKRLHEKREEREKSKIKKHVYEEMAKNGHLGAMELDKYTSMYENVPKEMKSSFKSPYNKKEKPNRDDYNRLKSFCCKNTSSLENRSYSPWRH